MNRALIALGALLIAFCGSVHAQQPVTTHGLDVVSKTPNQSGTIISTNTFQVVFTPSTTQQKRQGCTIANYGTHTMYVYFGQTTDTPAEANSVQLAANQFVNCNIGGVVLNDQVWITGTSGDAFFAAQQ
jgi:hypothetical protein